MTEPVKEPTPSSGPPSALLTAFEVVAQIVDSNPDVQSLSLVTYQEGPNWPGLFPTEKDNALPMLLKGLHQDRGERIFSKLSRKEISADRVRGVAHGLRHDQLLGVVSRVTFAQGETRHIPMMDFMCTPSPKNLDVLIRLITELRLGQGFLLESGRSYHYYGLALLTEHTWPAFLGKCLLMYGYVDDRYIGHQLVDGHCVLRLSAGELKKKIPRVVAELPSID